MKIAVLKTKDESDALTQAGFYRDHVLGAMSGFRLVVDEFETIVPKKYWPLPTYSEMLYSVY